MGALGGKAAFVVHGHGGLDELTTSGVNLVSHLHHEEVHTFELHPEALGLRQASLEQLRGGEPEENAQILLDLLSGVDTSPRRDVLLLNAAATLAVESGDLRAGLEEARHSLDSRAAFDKLEQLVAFSQNVNKSQTRLIV